MTDLVELTVRIENDKITDISDISGNGDSSNDRYITRASECSR